MHQSISFNYEIVSARDPLAVTPSSALLNGKGIFTTIAIYNGKPFLWEKHWKRLESNAQKIQIDLDNVSEAATQKALDEMIERNAVKAGRARLTFFDESASTVWPFESERKTSLLIITGDVRCVPRDLRLRLSPFRTNSTSPLAGVKSCNYLENLLALEEAKRHGSDEAVRLNERGEVTSASIANIFWLRDSVLYTPALKTGCLPGTTREFILDNLECREVQAGVEELNDAEAIFLTSAGLGVRQVTEFESKIFEKADHPILMVVPRASQNHLP